MYSSLMQCAFLTIQLTPLLGVSENIWILNLADQFAENEACGGRLVGNITPFPGIHGW